VKNKGYKKEKIFKEKEVFTNEEGTIYIKIGTDTYFHE